MAHEKRESSEEGIDPNAWMNTFCDLLLLMLTFFVLLLTMSSLDAQKLAEVARPGTLIKEADGSPVKDMIVLTKQRTKSPDLSPPRYEYYVARVPNTLPELENAQEELLTSLELNGSGWLERRPDQLAVHLDATAIFEVGGLKLTPQARGYIIETARVFAQNERAALRIEVWQDNGNTLLDQEAALDLALMRAEVLTRALTSQKVDEDDIQIGAYEGSAGVREDRFLRQPELVSFIMTFQPETLR